MPEEVREIKPIMLGRFNFVSFKKDVYDVVFRPLFDDNLRMIAKNLSYDEAIDLMDDLNNIVDDYRTKWKGKDYEPNTDT